MYLLLSTRSPQRPGCCPRSEVLGLSGNRSPPALSPALGAWRLAAWAHLGGGGGGGGGRGRGRATGHHGWDRGHGHWTHTRTTETDHRAQSAARRSPS